MRIRIPAWLTGCVALLSLSTVGCGPDFDSPSELRSLRVLAVQKDVPYAQPGQTVNLQMLWQDASSFAGREVQVAWSPPCFNPAGDLYYACFSDPNAFGTMVRPDPVNPERTSIEIPANIVRPLADDSNNAPYGITYVFFALCAGNFTLLPRSEDEAAFPIGCQDANGNLLGSDDFVAGYTSIYSFDSFSNHNPVIAGFEFRGKPLPKSAVCIDDGCLPLDGASPALDFDCDDPEQSARCVPTCADDGDSSCDGFAIRPTIDQADAANRDQDDVSAQLLGRTVGEQMWVNYYTDAGGLKSPVRLLNDATSGWNDDYGTDFYAPKAPGLSRIWAVAHDNRGGAAWAGITLKMQ